MDFKKILIAVDTSENAERAVSYVGDIIGSNPGFQIQLLYVERPLDRDLFPDEESWEAHCAQQREKVQEFFKRARGILEEKGVEPDVISERYVQAEGYSIAHSILRIHEDGGFGTVVVGRRGVSKAEEFLFGSVSNKIVHYAKDCTVWVVE